jgi:hypothetical protein
VPLGGKWSYGSFPSGFQARASLSRPCEPPDSPKDLTHVEPNLVFPHTEHLPAEVPQCPIHLQVALSVSENLGIPETRIGLRRSTVLSATVPEASVYEDGETKSSKDYIWGSGKCDSAAQSISIARPMERQPKG